MEGEASYQVVIKTNEGKADATTKAEVFIQLVGKDGGCSTDWEKLTRFWRRYFRQGNIDTFDLKLKDVGMPILVRLKIESGIYQETWGCDYVLVTYQESTEEFPIYDWITESIEATTGKATLPQDVDNEDVQKSRSNEKSRNKLLYEWRNIEKILEENRILPRHLNVSQYDDLPLMFKYDDRFVSGGNKDRIWKFRVNAAIQKIKDLVFGLNNLEEYNRLHEKLQSSFPDVHEKWHEDEEVGRQMLNGTGKTVRRCKGLPPYCKITDEHVQGLLREDASLDEEIVKGHIYIVDHATLTPDVKRSTQYGKGQLYCADPTALFYSWDGKFVPIAIQLEPHKPETIFTPKDEKYDWLLAKMYFRCADYNVNEYGAHFTTHTILAPIVIALFRCLPRSHPIHKLLRPHLSLIMAANQRGMDFFFRRQVAGIYRSQEAGDQTNECYSEFDFEELNFPKKMERRGLMDPLLLPNYHFRDDALLYWDVIGKFTGRIIEYYYKSDNDVRNDFELQNWINEIVIEGYTFEDGMKTKCYRNFETKEDLQTFCTITIFTASVYHASVHFPQFQIYKFIPNAPAGMRLPIHKRGEGSLQRILETLPTFEMSNLQVGVSFVAAGLDEQEILLGQYPVRYFTEPEVITILEKFSQDIAEIGETIKERNKGRQFPYEYLLPKRVPATITQ